MRVGLFVNDSDQAGVTTDTATEPQGGEKNRRAVTAMEYLVMTSFVVVVLIIGVQQVARVTSGMLSNSATATKFDQSK